jgi:hypothetical protein
LESAQQDRLLQSRKSKDKPLCQKKYSDDIIPKSTLIEGTIITVPNPQNGTLEFKNGW